MKPHCAFFVLILPALVIAGYPPMKKDRPAVLLFLDKLSTEGKKQLNEFCSKIFSGSAPDCKAPVSGGLLLQSFCQYMCEIKSKFSQLQKNERWLNFKRNIGDTGHSTMLSYQDPAVAAQEWLWKNDFFDNINKEFKLGTVTFKLGDNKFSTWALEEITKLSKLLLPSFDKNLPPMECNVAEFKQRIDHRPYMDVRDQGSCGSCWAFASTNAIQGAYSVMSNKKSMNYSTQQLLDCSGALCSGATFQSAVDYFKTSSIGLIPESSKAYVGEEKNPSCSSEGTPSDLFLHDFTLFHAKEPKTLIEIHDLENRLICSLQKGPVAVGIAATNEMTFYKEGVFDSVFDWVGSINHAVVVVGYEKDHFIVMNSYGSSWGENGYIRLPRGKNAFHMTEYQFAPKVVHKYPHYHQGIVYRLYKEAKNWQSAENRCKEDGGHLASIHNQEQEEFIHSLTIGANANVWIGLKANSWSDGSEMNFGLVSSACSSINNADGEKITESECNDQLQFICAIKA